MSRGKLISFEGIDGVGKSTQIKLLQRHLEGLGKRVTLLREPGSTKFGEMVRNLLLETNQPGESVSDLTKFLLFSAARSELVRTTIRPLIDDGETVLLDRYCDSSVAYQGYGSGVDVEFIQHINDEVTGGLYPDVTILLDLDVKSALSRLSSTDSFESKGGAFFKRVRDGYLTLASRYSERIKVVDASGDIDTISDQVVGVFL